MKYFHNEFINKTNNVLSNGFSIAAYVAKEMKFLEESEFAAKRAFSYNPINEKVLEKFPHFQTLISIVHKKIDHEILSAIINWKKLGNYYFVIGDFPNSFAAYSHAQNMNSNEKDPVFLYLLGIIYHHYDYYQHSLLCFKKVILYNQNYDFLSDIYFRLGIVYRNMNKYSKSLQYFRKSQLNPPHGLSLEDIIMQIAHTYHLMNENQKAGELYIELIGKHQKNKIIKQEYYWFLLSIATTENLIEMSNEINENLKNSGFDPIYYHILAKIHMKLNDYATSLRLFQLCVEYFNDNPIYWCNIGSLYCLYGNYQAAIISFQKAIYLKKDVVEAWLNMGYIYERQYDIQNAINIYSIGKQNCPENLEIIKRFFELQKTNNKEQIKSQLINIDCSKTFMQHSEQFANEYVKAVPLFPSSCFDETIDFNMLSTLPKSNFL